MQLDPQYAVLLEGLTAYREGRPFFTDCEPTVANLIREYVDVRPDVENEGNLYGVGALQIAPVPTDGGPLIGPWYRPNELIAGLEFVERHRPVTTLDIGTGNGWTTLLLAAVAQKQNPNARVVTVDPDAPQVRGETKEVAKLAGLNIEWHTGNVDSLKARLSFDLTVMDGAMHDRARLQKDWFTARRSRLIWMHDIANPFVGWQNAPWFWGDRVGRLNTIRDSVRIVVESGPDGSPRLGVGLFEQVPGHDIAIGCIPCKNGKRK